MCIKFLIVSDQLIIVSVGLWQTSVSFVGHRNCLIFECSGIQIVLVTIYLDYSHLHFNLFLPCTWFVGSGGGGAEAEVEGASTSSTTAAATRGGVLMLLMALTKSRVAVRQTLDLGKAIRSTPSKVSSARRTAKVMAVSFSHSLLCSLGGHPCCCCCC